MERDRWKRISRVLSRLAPTCPAGAQYTDRQVIAVLLWAALHDRSINWACQRRNWPPQSWRRVLPTQSTMSRRLRSPFIYVLLRQVLQAVQSREPASSRLFVDGKPYQLSEQTRDPDAAVGRVVHGYGIGYRLHLLTDERDRVLAWAIRPLNQSESVVALRLIGDARRDAGHLIAPGACLLADASYDSNRLYLRAAIGGMRLIAPRRKPGRGFTASVRHHADRIRSASLLEGPCRDKWTARLRRLRSRIERFFSSLVTAGGGLAVLPNWTRRWHRCEVWVGAKLIVNAVRIRLRASHDA